MNRKGQIFSLDFIISLAAIILVIGLMLQFMELQEYNQRESEIQNELYSIGETASMLLVSNPSFTCQMIMTNPIDDPNPLPVGGRLMNVLDCIPKDSTASVPAITKEELGIPNNYSCLIEAEDSGGADITDQINISDCLDNPDADNADNVYSSKREILFLTSSLGDSERISKTQLYNFCIKGEPGVCPLERGTITLKVWK